MEVKWVAAKAFVHAVTEEIPPESAFFPEDEPMSLTATLVAVLNAVMPF